LTGHALLPAPLRFDVSGRGFAFRSGTTVAYGDADLAPIVERFCADVRRRTGVKPMPTAGGAGSDGPSVSSKLATEDELGRLPDGARASRRGRIRLSTSRRRELDSTEFLGHTQGDSTST